ncbi:hypothetical protein TNCV_2952041, partial [Trichonephila clavipes]
SGCVNQETEFGAESDPSSARFFAIGRLALFLLVEIGSGLQDGRKRAPQHDPPSHAYL